MASTKELLSQNEIDALLELFNRSENKQNTDILFEVGMAKVAKAIGSYLDGLGLTTDKVRAVQSKSEVNDRFSYKPDYAYLERLAIDNALALAIIGARFGSRVNSATPERPLTSLERRLMQALCREIEYIVEKELDPYLRKAVTDKKIADSSVVITYANRQSTLQFSFTVRSTPVAQTRNLAQKKEAVSADTDGTKVEASVGRLMTDTLEKGKHYKVAAFDKNNIHLLLDSSMVLMAGTVEKSNEKLSVRVKKSVTEKTVNGGYELVVAGTVMDDETFLSLEYGSLLALTLYDDVQVHKDGKIVAKAKVCASGGEITVKVL